MKIFDGYKNKKVYARLILSSFLLYVFTICIKMGYSSQMAAIIDDYDATKANVALGMTLYYCVYALSQIFLATIIKKINMRLMIFGSTILSALSFGAIGLTDKLWQLWLIMGLNGIFQSSVWGGLMYFCAKHLPNKLLTFFLEIASTGFSFGTALTYGISAFFVAFFSWKFTFVFFAVFLFLSVLFFYSSELKAEKLQVSEEKELEVNHFKALPSEEATNNSDNLQEKKVALSDEENDSAVIPEGIKFNVTQLFIYFVCISFLTLSVYYGVNNWIPNLLKEVYAFPVSLSILITLIVPFVSMFAPIISIKFFDKHNKYLLGIMVIMASVQVLLGLMIFTYKLNMFYAFGMCLLLIFLLRANVSASYTSIKLKNHINSGKSTLILNAAASFGAGVLPFISSAVMDAYGWQVFFTFMSIINAVLLIILVIGLIRVKKKNIISKWF